MRKLIIITALSLWAGLLIAENYKVLYVNDTSLTYNDGRKVEKGDIISDANTIKWEKEKQAVKVINLTTKKQSLFTSTEWARSKGLGALVYVRRASTQASGNSYYAKLFNTFKNEYELLDSIEVETDIELSDSCYFTAAYMYGDTKLVKKLSHQKGKVIIDKSLFDIDNKKLDPRDVTLSIEYVNKLEKKYTFVRDKIDLLVYPEIVE